MKLIFPLIVTLLSGSLQAQVSNKMIHDLKAGNTTEDTSYVYWLPFPSGSKYLLIQAGNSRMSHKHRLALDFKMKKGSKICAAREGVVEEIKEDSDIGGLKNKYLSDGNHVIIRHGDGSVAWYWHMKKNGVFVNPGDTVHKGQVIGLSGNTGYSAFPHLHFQVQDKNGKDVLTRFLTPKGIKYLRPLHWYRGSQDDIIAEAR